MTIPSSGSRTNASGCEKPRLDRRDQGDPHHGDGEQGQQDGSAGLRLAIRSALRRLRRPAVPPQPPDVTPERLGEQGERDGEARRGSPQAAGPPRPRPSARFPVPPRPSCASRAAAAARASRRTPNRPRGTRSARRRSRAPRPGRGRDLDAEREDQEGIDLAVHLRSQCRLRLGAPGDPSVDEIERECDGRERHERRDRHVPHERLGGQRRDADGERRPGERHPVCRAEPRCGVAPERAGERPVEDQPRRDPTTQPARPRPTVCVSVARSSSWAPSPASGPGAARSSEPGAAGSIAPRSNIRGEVPWFSCIGLCEGA